MSSERLRDVLLVLLAVTTGATDATVFERLGHVFASVVTGNLVLVGISSVQADGTLALFAGCALAAYAAGVLLAAPRHRGPSDGKLLWPGSASVALGVESLALMAFAVGSELAGAPIGRTAQLLLLVAAGVAMGIQSTAVRRLGQMSTTYLTSTLTGVVESLAVRRWPPAMSRSTLIILAAVAGAAAGTALIEYARPWLPALQLVPVFLVLLASRRLAGVPAEDP